MAKIKIHSRYGVIPNELLNNKEITFKAKGIYAYIQSKSDDWDFSCEKIAVQSRESVDAIKTGIKELESAGYLKRTKIHNEKGYFDTEYILYEKPMVEKPSMENTYLEVPAKEIPTMDFPLTDNGTNNSNKDLSNKDLIKEISKEIFEARILELEKENQLLKERKEKNSTDGGGGKKQKEEPPSQAEFMDYAKSVVENDLKKPFDIYEFVIFSKYETWLADGWKDGNKKPILNWKSKFKNTLPFLKPVFNGNSNNNFATGQPTANTPQRTNLFGKDGKSANRLVEIGKRTPISELRRKTTFEVCEQ